MRGGFLPAESFGLCIHLAGLTIGTWALISMRASKLNIFPQVRPGSRLIQNGPYRMIRHPMYTALLIFFLPHAWQDHQTALLYLLLFIIMIFKLKYEEKLLQHSFPNYSIYRKKTYALLPYIY